jgi:hypothetical protein
MATKENRIYLVKNSAGVARLIEAPNKSAAMAYAVKTTLTVELATQSQLVSMVQVGTEVESVESDGMNSGV